MHYLSFSRLKNPYLALPQYRYYGLKVVKACVEGGAHVVDISGEPQYLEQSQLDYNEAAQKAGKYVVGSCGFDSIPADLGTSFLQEVFPGDGRLLFCVWVLGLHGVGWWFFNFLFIMIIWLFFLLI